MGQCHNPYPLCHNCSMLLTSVFADFAHLMLLHLVDHHAAQLLLGVVVAQLLLVQWRAREQIILIRSLACKIFY